MSDRVWLTADTHFGHRAIVEHCGRPFADVGEMDEEIVRRWNVCVGKKDVVWHLGDFALGPRDKVLEYAKRLNGKIHVIVGNHDNPNHLRAAFGETRVFDVREIGYAGHRIYLSHYAHRVWPSSHHGSFHAYGHSHGGLDRIYGQWGRSMDVGVDRHAFAPLSADEFIQTLTPAGPTDHHPEQQCEPSASEPTP